MNVLDIYLTRHCFGCQEAFNIAREIGLEMPCLAVELRYLEEMKESEIPEVVATPSYFFNGLRIFMGNPKLDELMLRVTSLTEQQ